MQFLTDFADQAVLLPLAALVALALAFSGWGRGLAVWVVAVAGVLGTMAVLKVAFFTCAGLVGESGVRSPSGHTAASTAILGGALVLFLRGRVPGALLVAIPLGVAVVFGLSRLAVHAHTLPEVLVGGAIGLAGVAALHGVAGPGRLNPGWPLLLGGATAAIGLHGLRLDAEPMLHILSALYRSNGPGVCA